MPPTVFLERTADITRAHQPSSPHVTFSTKIYIHLITSTDEKEHLQHADTSMDHIINGAREGNACISQHCRLEMSLFITHHRIVGVNIVPTIGERMNGLK